MENKNISIINMLKDGLVKYADNQHMQTRINHILSQFIDNAELNDLTITDNVFKSDSGDDNFMFRLEFNPVNFNCYVLYFHYDTYHSNNGKYVYVKRNNKYERLELDFHNWDSVKDFISFLKSPYDFYGNLFSVSSLEPERTI